MSKPGEQRFLKDVAEHRMSVVMDNGLHRHVRFQKPDTYCMSFDLVTWPGYLAYCGDMGEFVFSRLPDMFEFFRTAPSGKDGLYINPSYWGEKCRAGVVTEYDPDEFIAAIHRRLTDMDASRDVREAVEADVLPAAHEGEHAAHIAARDFEHEGEEIFPDFWECDLRPHTHRFLWCCYALAWGIRQYDAAKVPA